MSRHTHRPRKGRNPKTGGITLPFRGIESNPHTIRVDRHKPNFIKKLYEKYVDQVGGIVNAEVCEFINMLQSHPEVIEEEVTYNNSRICRLWKTTYN